MNPICSQISPIVPTGELHEQIDTAPFLGLPDDRRSPPGRSSHSAGRRCRRCCCRCCVCCLTPLALLLLLVFLLPVLIPLLFPCSSSPGSPYAEGYDCELRLGSLTIPRNHLPWFRHQHGAPPPL